jgi:excisionase family DNA binding protein
MNIESDKPLLLTVPQTAHLLSVSVATLYRLHSTGRIPLPIKLGRSVRWSASELIKWAEAGCPGRQVWEEKK